VGKNVGPRVAGLDHASRGNTRCLTISATADPGPRRSGSQRAATSAENAPAAVRPNFSIATVTTDGETRIYLRGELDVASAPELEQALDVVFTGSETSGPAPIVIDCAGLSYCDSFGVRSIIIAAGRASDAAVEIRIEHAIGRVRQILEISGVGEIVRIE
jgi:anti-anti-sigma factor